MSVWGRVGKWWPDSDLGRDVTAWNWYAYGLVSIDANIYQFISHCAELRGWGWFDGCQLVWRPAGETGWLRWNGSDANDDDRWFAGAGRNELLFHNEPERAFSFITVAQFGRDYEQNRDGYVYLYSPNGTQHPEQLNLVRVRKDHILDRTQYEYFQERTPDGGAVWVRDSISARGAVHEFPQGWGWYSWSPSVVWNEPLGLFVMAAGGTQRPGTGEPMDSYMHYDTGEPDASLRRAPLGAVAAILLSGAVVPATTSGTGSTSRSSPRSGSPTTAEPCIWSTRTHATVTRRTTAGTCNASR